MPDTSPAGPVPAAPAASTPPAAGASAAGSWPPPGTAPWPPGSAGPGTLPAGGAPAAAIPGEALSSPLRRLLAHVLEGVLLVVTLGVGWLVWSVLVWGRGQTPAKQLLHMRCLDARTGRAAGTGTMVLREGLGKWVLSSATAGLTMVIGGAMVLATDRQALWDKLATTVVVDDPQDRWAPAP
jgi:hypothetical protein